MKRTLVIAALASALLAGMASAAPLPGYIQKAIADPKRPKEDTSRDVQRLPGELIAWAGIRPGMSVVDLLPGTGYFTRIFADVVGPKGHVYSYFGPQYDDRLVKAGVDPNNQFVDIKAQYPNVGTIHGPLAGFVTPTLVDVVWISDNYHDTHNKQYAADVAGMNKAVFASLKHGGVYIIVDHRAVKGAGAGSTEALHRMDEDIAKQEIEAAGFKLVAESNMLTRPQDDDTKRVFEEGEHDHTDQMVLKFRKP
jgi:predicted methyltransferase